MNSEGYWGIDVDNGACAASMTLQGGAIFLLRGYEGQVTFGLFSTKGAFRKGKVGRIRTDASGIDFEPHFGDEGDTLYNVEEFNEPELAALRSARHAQILVDGRPVASMTLEGTGFEGALAGVIACSKGESGWWGKGVAAEAAADEPQPASRPMHEDGIWALEADEDACVALAQVDGGVSLIVIATNGGRDLMLGAGSDTGFRHGRRGLLETDAFKLSFKPMFDGKRNEYLQLDQFLDSQTLFALRRATSVYISIDGVEVVSAKVGETAFAEVMDDARTCAAGRKGWWGEGAKRP